MQSITAALTYDYLRRSALPVALSLLYMVGFPWFAYSLMRWNGVQAPAQVWRDAKLPFSFLVVMSFAVLIVVLIGQGTKLFGLSKQLYVLPIPTWLAVANRMLQAGITAMALCVVAVQANNMILGTSWPLLAPALALAVLIGWSQAFAWTLWDFRLGKVAGLFAVLASLGYWMLTHFQPEGANTPARSWEHVSAMDALVLGGSALAAFTLSVWSVNLHRRGDSQSFESWIARFEAWWDLVMGRGQQRFQSPEAAVFWQEWTRRGLAMPAAMGFLLLVVPVVGAIAVALGGARPIAVLEVQLAVALPVFPQMAFIIGMFLGHRNTNSSSLEYDAYSATRPLTDAALSTAFLRSAALSVLSAYAIGAACCLATVGWVCWQQGPAELKSVADKIPLLDTPLGGWAVVLIALTSLLGTWASLGIGASLVLTGRSRLIAWGMGLPIAAMIVAVIVINFIVPREMSALLSAAATGLLGLLLLGGTAWAFAKALALRVTNASTAIASFVCWLGLCGAAAAAISMMPATNNPAPAYLSWLALPFVLGSIALVFAPLATAPLALWFNRHR